MIANSTDVDVVLPAGAQPDKPILVDSSSPIVTRLPFLNWVAAGTVGGIQRSSLSNSEAMAAFAIKCRLDRTPAELAAANIINPLTIGLTDAAWSRLLTEIRDCGFLSINITIMEQLHAYIKSKVTTAILGAIDWAPAPPFTAGNSAPARVASSNIRYLGLANVAGLEIQTGALAATAPWAALCRLVGAIGDVGTQAARMAETSDVQAIASFIRAHGGGGNTDAALAHNLRSDLLRATLPKVFRAHGATAAELGEEMADSFIYKRSAADRKAVEQKRIDLISPWCAHTPFATKSRTRMPLADALTARGPARPSRAAIPRQRESRVRRVSECAVRAPIPRSIDQHLA
jgi:hypothetical protein